MLEEITNDEQNDLNSEVENSGSSNECEIIRSRKSKRLKIKQKQTT